MPDTSSANGYKSWVESHVVSRPETFTSSMLLRQGEADRLLKAGPKERTELLGTVVGLEQYEALYKRAFVGHTSRKGHLEAMDRELLAMTVVSDKELADAEDAVQATKDALAVADQCVERVGPLLEQSNRWSGLRRDVCVTESEREKLAELLSRRSHHA